MAMHLFSKGNCRAACLAALIFVAGKGAAPCAEDAGEGGTATETAMLTVAPADADEPGRSGADFIATGESDQQVIQRAIDQLAAGTGGTVRLLAGTFRTNAPVLLPGGITLEGVAVAPTAGDPVPGDELSPVDLSTWPRSATLIEDIIVRNLVFRRVRSHAIEIQGNVHGVVIENIDARGVGGEAVRLGGSGGVRPQRVSQQGVQGPGS